MIILGVSAFYHDSAAAILIDGKIEAAAQEERFSRIKNDHSFPINAIKFCLKQTGITLKDVDALVFYDKAFLKFERITESYLNTTPYGFKQLSKALPLWIGGKLNMRKLIKNELKKIEDSKSIKLKILFSSHHLSHAASTFYPSKFQDSAILTIDGVGEWTTTAIHHGKNNEIETLSEIHYPHSLGILYSAFTQFLGFKINSGEYKLMGLAPYGNPEDEQTINFIKIIKEKLLTIHDDGSFALNLSNFEFHRSLKTINIKKWEKLFEISSLKADEKPTKAHCNLAFAIQNITEEIVVKLAKYAHEITKSKNLCLAGGVALNCVANGKLLEENIFENIYIQPASGDAGGALGAALAASAIYFDEYLDKSQNDCMMGSYLGPQFEQKEIDKLKLDYKADFQTFISEDKLIKETAKLINSDKIVGWFQGRMEFGPRALGNRSILAKATNLDMQMLLNNKIKLREEFRPFAPSICEEDIDEYFHIKQKSPYMLLIAWLKDEHRKQLPENYLRLNPEEQLKTQRSDFQAITHVDFSARLHTVSKEINPKYWKLLQEIKNIQGNSILVNTSFNVRGEPIVCTPEDAYLCFMQTEIDALVINNCLFLKQNQSFAHEFNWNREFIKD